jgi:hypothetical protein
LLEGEGLKKKNAGVSPAFDGGTTPFRFTSEPESE